MPISDAKQTFRYAASAYLYWWIKFDREFVDQFSEQLNDEVLNKFLTKYKVRRTIKGDDLRPFVSILQKYQHLKIDEEEASNVVSRAAEEMKATYGRGCLSAVSKALWMTKKHPIAMYDKYACDTLLELSNQNFVREDYIGYHQAWRNSFEAKQRQIKDAQTWLLTSDYFDSLIFHGASTRQQLESWILADFFANRIFDHWLIDATKRPHVADLARYVGRIASTD